MPTYRGSAAIANLLRGTTAIAKIYKGSTLLWQAQSGDAPVWSDDFTALDLENVTAAPNKWTHLFKLWAVRSLAANSDDGLKTYDEKVEAGRTRSVKQVLEADGRWASKARYLHQIVDGALVLRGYPIASGDQVDTAGYPYVCGMISNEADATLAKMYGYWEVRLKLGVTKGQHFAAWLVPPSGQAWYEIDLLEVVGSSTTTVADWHCNSHEESPAVGMTAYRPKDPTGWHTIGFEWTADDMRWYFDGIVVRQHPNYVNDRTGYFMATWELDSTWPGPPDGATVWPCEAFLDHVKYYSTKPAAALTGWSAAGSGATGWSKNTTALTLAEPLNARPGDLQVAVIAYRGNVPFAAPSGWSIAVQDTRGNSSYFGTGWNVASVAILWRVRGSGAVGTVAFSKGAGTIDSLDIYQGQIIGFVPATGTTVSLVGAQANVDFDTTTAPVVVPSITTVAGDLCVCVGAGSTNAAAVSSIASATGPGASSGTDNTIGKIEAGPWAKTVHSSAWNDPSLTVSIGAAHAVSPGGAIGNTTVTFDAANGHAAAVAVFRAA